uniref:TRAUB domain-containing protein n=1 Tax=Syphacia muris TaxID=451379 RepID=A0A0N5AT97_9BILA
MLNVMSYKHRLIRRTQIKRSDGERIGGNSETVCDSEIFDDDDFYQQILRDLIEKKTTNTSDPIEMSRQWIQIQQLRQKRSKKKVVDTKASKGRKIRYVVIPKLVNYFPSTPETVKWSHEMRNQLFQSLFTSSVF